jgi:hypothetical protein
VPRELLHAADRIARGDFAARVVPLAGSMGTVASALNKAAEAAEQALARPALVPDLFAPAAPEPTGPDPFAARVAARRAPPAAPAAPETSGTDLFAPLPGNLAPEGAQAEPPAFAPLNNSVSGATSLATRPEDLLRDEAAAEPPARSLAQPAPTPPPFLASTPVPGGTPPPLPAATPPPAPGGDGGAPGDDPDAGHWQQVFEEFLRIRASCGEATEGLTADRFLAKLRANRTSLMQKHDCRTVRFQVYVKEGRAAIKATPVK